MKNKTKEILNWLEDGHTLTQNQALKMFRTSRLASIIFNLRNQGHDIKMVTVEDVDIDGDPVKFGKYYLEKR